MQLEPVHRRKPRVVEEVLSALPRNRSLRRRVRTVERPNTNTCRTQQNNLCLIFVGYKRPSRSKLSSIHLSDREGHLKILESR